MMHPATPLLATLALAAALATPAAPAAAVTPAAPALPAGVSERMSALTVDGERIPAAIDLPAAGTPRAAVLIVPGAFNSDVDGNYLNQGFYPHTYADIARGLAQRGFATLRYAKDGDGSGTTIVDPLAAGKHDAFAERVVVAAAALRVLHDAAPQAPLAVAGHSEGGLVAALLAARDPSVRALIDLEAPGRPITQVLEAQVHAMLAHLEDDDMETAQIASLEQRAFDAAVDAVRNGARIPATALTDRFVSLYFGKATDAELAYLRQEDTYDPAQVIAQVRQPVLIVQSRADEVVFPEDAQVLDQARVAAHLPTTLVMLGYDQHLYKRIPSGTPAYAALHLSGQTDPAVIERVAAWLHEALATLWAR